MQEILNKIFENGEKINKLSFFTKALGALRLQRSQAIVGCSRKHGCLSALDIEFLMLICETAFVFHNSWQA